MDNYKLDPAWYFTSPGLAWDAVLKLTDVELQLLSDYDMLLMIKGGIRGGISTISKRYGWQTTGSWMSHSTRGINVHLLHILTPITFMVGL